ncbi:MAG: 50S ribosomal protein L11 methyltransferase [Bacteroidia bacterium]
MNYIELDFIIKENTNVFSEILIAQLGELDFEMFEENENGFKAYIQENVFDESRLSEIDLLSDTENISYSKKIIKNQNWNKEWESNFQPVIIGTDVYIRADFHPVRDNFKYQIVIQPEMSFGTGHHETTSSMIELMLNYDFKNKTVCDMGCGTGILAVMAEKLGAADVLAIDYDENCVRNAATNLERNNTQHIEVIEGDADALKGKTFQIILANINRNILLVDISKYVEALQSGGLLFVSGFYEEDFSIIKPEFEKHNLKYKESMLKNKWCAAVFKKL